MPGKSGRDDEKSNASNTSENTSLNTKKKTKTKLCLIKGARGNRIWPKYRSGRLQRFWKMF